MINNPFFIGFVIGYFMPFAPFYLITNGGFIEALIYLIIGVAFLVFILGVEE